MGKKREADRTDGADWGGAQGKPVAARVLSHNAGSAKSAKNVIASESPQPMSSVIGFLNLAIPFDLLRFPALSSVSPNWSNWT